MKPSLKNEVDIISLINKVQEQITLLDKKIESLINRSTSEPKPAPTPQNNNEGRKMHTAVCADCKKECTIPFKPSGDRPVYCKDCFSRRKVISLSKIGADPKFVVTPTVQTPVIKPIEVPTKKTTKTKKPVAKKKAAPKKK